MSMASAALQKKTQIHFVTGKGGVGKTLTAAALAKKLSQTKADGSRDRVLLVELGDESRIGPLLKMGSLGSRPIPGPWGFDVALWSGISCLHEYALQLLKLESLYRLFFENPVSRSLIDVAPALQEIAILGKVTSGPPRNVGPKMVHSTLVVDAHSTGHFMALMRAPVGLKRAIDFGPIAEQSKSILAVIKDTEQTFFHLVSLCEEMPVLETLELMQFLKVELGASAKLYLNKVFAPTEGPAGGSSRLSQAFLQEWNRQYKSYCESKEKLGTQHTIELPFIFSEAAPEIITQLSRRL